MNTPEEAPERVKPAAPSHRDTGGIKNQSVADTTAPPGRPPTAIERLVLRAPLLHRGSVRDASAVALATGLGVAVRLLSTVGSGSAFLMGVSVLALFSPLLGPAAVMALVAAGAVGHVAFVSLMSSGVATLGFDVASAEFELPFLRLFGQQFLAEGLAILSGGLLAFHLGAFALALDTSSVTVQILLSIGAFGLVPFWVLPVGALFLLGPSMLMFGGVVLFAEPTPVQLPPGKSRRAQAGGLRFTF